MDIQPIETSYCGCRFRSRLEARWAVVFNELEIPWEYEKEGFRLTNGQCYLPDFWLPSLDCFWEVKGEEPPHDALIKAMLLSAGLKKPVVISSGTMGLQGPPEYPCNISGFSIKIFAGNGWDMWEHPQWNNPWWDSYYWEGEFSLARFVKKHFPEEIFWDFNEDHRKKVINFDCRYFMKEYGKEHPIWKYGRWHKDAILERDEDNDWFVNFGVWYAEEVDHAYRTARSARFEE
jgi:hypothetical protein